jgi:hypothetical protein
MPKIQEVEEAQVTECEAVKAKRGRPRGDYANLIGTEYNGNLILSIIDGPRSGNGPKVTARCAECGSQYETRLRRLRSGETKSCGCLKRRNFRNYLAAAVSKLSLEVVAGCWIARQTMNRERTAAKFRLQIAVVDAAQRRYQAHLDSLISDGTALKLHRLTGEGGNGDRMTTAQAAAEAELPIEAARYLIFAAARRMRDQEEATKGQRAFSRIIARAACKVLADVEVRQPTTKWTKSWTPELTHSELRLSKGQLVGSNEYLYELCLSVDRSALDKDEQAVVDEFLQLARRTLADRRERRDAYVRQMRADQILELKAA